MTYRYLTGLADVCRKAGLKVSEVDGWKTRGRPASTGGFDPVGVLCHHTATGRSSSDADVIRLLVNGRSDLPGPLAQLGLGRDGTVYVIAAGRANHAGTAKASGTVAAGDGNQLYIGIEAFNDGVGEPWPAVQYSAYVKLCAVLCDEITGNSAQTVRGHKETSVTGKIDPTFNMDDFRARVTSAMGSKPPKPEPRRLTLATFNLLRGRPARTVEDEVGRLWEAANLKALAVQEAEGYFHMLNAFPGADYFADAENPENGILVAEGCGSNFFTNEVGDGWIREGGAKRGPGEFPRVTVDDWCRIGSTHLPVGTSWVNGKLVGPPERLDDQREWAEAGVRFLSLEGTRVWIGDKNERARTRGIYSPGWVAEQVGARIGTTGGIDWGVVVNGRFENVRTSPIREGSDHEPEVFEVVES